MIDRLQHRLTTAALALALPLVLSESAAAQVDGQRKVRDKTLVWPAFRGPAGDGVAPAGKPPTKWSDEENLAWKRELPGPGSSTPIVVGDRVYVTCYSGYGGYLDDGGDMKKLAHHLVCVARKTGELIFEKTVPGPLARRPPRVQLSEHGFASPTPVTDGDTIFVYFGRAGLFAFSAEDGEQRWHADLGEPSEDAGKPTNQVVRNGRALTLRWGSAASPVLHDGLVFVNASEESNSLLAFDQRTGKQVWRKESANLEGCAISPVIVGKGDDAVLVQGLGGDVWGLDPKTGKLLWTVETFTRGGMSPTPVADADIVYVFGGEGQSHALRFARMLDEKGGTDEQSARVKWKGANLDIPTPVLYDGRLFLVGTTGIATCLDKEDGKQLYNKRLEGRTGPLYSSPVIADGRMYVVSRKRGTFVYSTDGEFKLLSRNELSDENQFNGSPAVAGDQLFLRSDRFLYCIARS